MEKNRWKNRGQATHKRNTHLFVAFFCFDLEKSLQHNSPWRRTSSTSSSSSKPTPPDNERAPGAGRALATRLPRGEEGGAGGVQSINERQVRRYDDNQEPFLPSPAEWVTTDEVSVLTVLTAPGMNMALKLGAFLISR